MAFGRRILPTDDGWELREEASPYNLFFGAQKVDMTLGTHIPGMLMPLYLNLSLVRPRLGIESLLNEQWGSSHIITCGKIHNADQLPGFIALDSEKPVGLITYLLNDNECEIITLNSLEPGKGIGQKLLKAVLDYATIENCNRVWLITTNDNTNALRFYQRNGFQLVSVHKGAIENSRKLKPEIPEIGFDGIPIRDEIEMEYCYGS